MRNQSIGFHFESDLPFCTCLGAGYHSIQSKDYYWDNRKRNGNFCLLQYCVDGCGSLEMGGNIYTLKAGDLFLIQIPSDSSYYLGSDQPFWKVIYLEFSNEVLPLLRKIHELSSPIYHVEKESSIEKQILNLYEKAIHDEINTYFENSKLAYCLWMDLTSLILQNASLEKKKMEAVHLFIEKNYTNENMNLDYISQCLHLSKYYICKEYKKEYGISVGQYIKELRISHACRLLTTNSQMKMQDIAQAVGYSNNNYFGKVFRAQKGISPDAFRKQSNHYDLVRMIYEK
ncbi:MAG: helix-turn-helix domain-containing protein [Firmicutes bacterium]|nr:helix-turn-helix domain-containing protein [Bacillota bacterium]